MSNLRSVRILVLVAPVALGACYAMPASPTPATLNTMTAAAGSLSLETNQWQTISTPPRFPLENDGGGHLMFDFPANGAINYLYTFLSPQTIAGTLSVSVQITTSGPVVFNMAQPGNTCVTPPSVRPMIWAHKNSWDEFARWWSNPTGYALANGVAELSIPLTADRWSSVFGKFGNADAWALRGFTSALGNVSSLALSFGGGCYFGHGVYVQGGRAQFALLKYQIQN